MGEMLVYVRLCLAVKIGYCVNRPDSGRVYAVSIPLGELCLYLQFNVYI